MRRIDRQERRAIRQAGAVGIDLSLEGLRMLADHIQHHREHDDVEFVTRATRRVTWWRVRIGAKWFLANYDNMRHVIEGFAALPERERTDVDPKVRVETAD